MNAAVRELEVRLLQASTPATRLGALLELAERHAAAFRNREGLRAAREALEIARERRDDGAIARALAAATTCHYQRGDYLAAVAAGLDAVAAYPEGDGGSRSGALQSIALALFALMSLDLAEECADRAVADAMACGDRRREAGARAILARVLLADSRFDDARREFRQAARLHREGGDALGVKKAVAGIGHAYRRQAAAASTVARAAFHRRQAVRVYGIALAAGHALADDAAILCAIAECRLGLGEVEAAAREIARAVDLAQRVDSAAILAECHLWEAHVLREQGELQAAELACGRACAAAEALVHDEMLAHCLRALASVHDAQGRFERASDVEERGREVRLALEASLACIRTELAPLWARHAQGRRPPAA